MVVRSTLGGEDGAAERRAPSGSAATATTSTTRTTPRRPRRRRYTVQAGDTLTAIAERTGVPVSRLRDLNPGTDPQSLRTGQRLRLAP